MLIGTGIAAAFLIGYLAGHFELLGRIHDMGVALGDWAQRYDASGRRGWRWRMIVAPVLIFRLIILHPIRGTRAYRQAKLHKRRTA
ncbi:hypothetical protein [Streptomyces javensis]|uniref:Uncharacterized protein n=1 Tax=Streptomyces javensis TaxID=114698 RepID=A0ABS0R5R4_9ACTN|nr:hypothetical protein [Streptomyces javensis]MBI0312709.1 hypothetical protein [Streptomyces javensis]